MPGYLTRQFVTISEHSVIQVVSKLSPQRARSYTEEYARRRRVKTRVAGAQPRTCDSCPRGERRRLRPELLSPSEGAKCAFRHPLSGHCPCRNRGRSSTSECRSFARL